MYHATSERRNKPTDQHTKANQHTKKHKETNSKPTNPASCVPPMDLHIICISNSQNIPPIGDETCGQVLGHGPPRTQPVSPMEAVPIDGKNLGIPGNPWESDHQLILWGFLQIFPSSMAGFPVGLTVSRMQRIGGIIMSGSGMPWHNYTQCIRKVIIARCRKINKRVLISTTPQRLGEEMV